MILCLGPTPAAQRVMRFPTLTLDRVNRAVVTVDGFAGKAVNVAKVLKALGEEPLVTGFAGGERGEQLRSELTRREIRHEYVSVAAPTRQCITVMDDATGEVTELVEESRAVTPADYEQLLAMVRRHLPGCRALVMSGTLTPGGPVDFYAQCLSFLSTPRPLTIVDTQGPVLLAALKERPGVIKPNRHELAAATHRALADDAAVLAAICELREQGAEGVIVTAGKLPTLVFDGRNAWRIYPPEIKAVNPIGSGDAFTAALAARLVRGDDLAEACRWGAATGAANALTLMAGEVNPADVRQLLNQTQIERLTPASP